MPLNYQDIGMLPAGQRGNNELRWRFLVS